MVGSVDFVRMRQVIQAATDEELEGAMRGLYDDAYNLGVKHGSEDERRACEEDYDTGYDDGHNDGYSVGQAEMECDCER